MKIANILDPIHEDLDQTVYNGITPKYSVQHFIKKLYYRALDKELGVTGEEWADLYITGSLTTYQYSVTSDCDVSVFPDYDLIWKKLGLDPDSARKKLIGLSIENIDGTFLPGTTHPLQFFVVPHGQHPHDLYKPGLRSAFDLHDGIWFQKPEKDRVHDVALEYPELFKRAQAIGDKLTQMLDAKDDDAARELWHQIHMKRQLDQRAGLGDFCEGNIVYKYLLNEGLFDRIRDELHEYIAKSSTVEWVGSDIDEGHADTRFPWIFVPETDRLVIGSPGSSHRMLMKYTPDADQGTEWYGAYGSTTNRVTIFSQYDFDDFNKEDIDQDLIRNLREAWPTATIWHNDEDGDRVKYEAKLGMAERTGDPQLDKLINQYVSSRMLREMMRDPQWAAGACAHESEGLAKYLYNNGIKAWMQSMSDVGDDHYKTFDEMGYGDRQPGKFDSHAVVIAETENGRYMIDLTAAQYGYNEFPMVQKLDGSQWQREFSSSVKWSMPPAAQWEDFADSLEERQIDGDRGEAFFIDDTGTRWRYNHDTLKIVTHLLGTAITFDVSRDWMEGFGRLTYRVLPGATGNMYTFSIILNQTLSPEAASYSLWHEIQHAFQLVEGRMEPGHASPAKLTPDVWNDYINDPSEVDADDMAAKMRMVQELPVIDEIPVTEGSEKEYYEELLAEGWPQDEALDMLPKPEEDVSIEDVMKARGRLGWHVAKDLWDERVSQKVIYDFDKDTITLGTQATQAESPDSKIIGEYEDGCVTLYGVEKQWISPQYFHKLWAFSYPEKELKDVYYKREDNDRIKLRRVRPRNR